MASTETNTQPLLVVDLDGTLVLTDTLWESIVLLVKYHPKYLVLLPFWLFRGKVFFKRKIADIITPKPECLPYNEQLITYIKEQRRRNRTIILLSASDNRIVQKVSDYLGIFDEAIGTEETQNLRGRNKVTLLRQKYPDRQFEYAGNGNEDIPVWKDSWKALIVSNNKRLLKTVNRIAENSVHLGIEKKKNVYIKALRPHQWIKNVLVFVPFLLAHPSYAPDTILNLVLAFISMSFCASCVYVMNDILDMESDRSHKEKKHRPFASGMISIPKGIAMIVVLLTLSFGSSVKLLSIPFSLTLLSYFTFATLYSLILKRLMLIDVLGLSAFYTIRLFAGSVAAEVPITTWFLGFSSFFFLSLAFIKRYIELLEYTSHENDSSKLKHRGYEYADIPVVLAGGLASGHLSVLLFCLYITSSETVNTLYTNPKLLWFIAPLLTYWISRLWILAQRKVVHSDPVLFAAKDPASWIIGIIVGALVVLSAVF